MYRIVNSVFTPILTLNVKVVREDGTFTVKKLKVDDEVADLRYVENKTIQKVSGRVASIGYKLPKKKVKRYYTNPSKLRSYFEFDVTPNNIVIDDSEVRHSKLIDIPVKDMLEDSGVTDVDHIETWLSFAMDASVEISDGSINTFRLKEGQTLTNVTYLFNGDDVTLPEADLIAMRYDDALGLVALEMRVNGKPREVAADKLVNVGSTSDFVEPYDFKDTTIADVPNGGTLTLTAGNFSAPIALTKSITIKGAKAGTPATGSGRVTSEFVGNLTGETVLSGKITSTGEVDITLDGVALTGDAVLNIGNASSLTLKNCVIKGIVAPSNRDFLIRTSNGTPTKLVIEGCVFSKFSQVTGKNIYNLFELDCKLKDGSSISNNRFQSGCCNHNDICIYGADENATITIANNVWEKSANAIRIGTKGNPTYTAIFENNEYRSTDEDPAWAGLLLIQPYVKQTTSMLGTTIKINNTKRNDDGQLFYVYTGKNDLILDSTNAPTVFVDGEQVDIFEVYQNYGVPVTPTPTPETNPEGN